MAGQAIDPDRDALLRALHQSGAAFVVIGGAALQSHGLAYTTQDIDVTPARSKTNLQRLATTLNDLDCKLVVDVADSSQDVPVPADYFTADNLARQETWKLNTRHGKLASPSRPPDSPPATNNYATAPPHCRSHKPR